MARQLGRSEQQPLSVAIDLEPLVERILARLRPVMNGDAPAPAKRAFRIAEVAELLSLSVREIEELVARNELESFKVGRVRLITPSQIDEFITRKLADRNGAQAD